MRTSSAQDFANVEGLGEARRGRAPPVAERLRGILNASPDAFASHPTGRCREVLPFFHRP
jgi:hypothetical protein